MHTSVCRSFSPPSAPYLPPELVLQILTELWEEPQTSQERRMLYKNLCSVNRGWLALFIRVAMRTVHIPILDANTFLSLLPERTLRPGDATDLFTTEACTVTNTMCRSLHFHVDGQSPAWGTAESLPAIKLYSSQDPSSNAVSTVLYMVSALDYLPNLRHVALQYSDWGYDDVFEQLREDIFPPQVTHLSIDYSFSAPALIPLTVYLKTLYTRRPPPRVTLPNVRHLSVSGVPTEFVADMLRVCPNVDTVQMFCPARLQVLAPLPPSVRTLVLHHPGIPLDRETMHWWTLDMALEGGLFPRGVKGQIVVRSSTPDPAAFAETKQMCRRYGVDLVYDRDDERMQ